MSDSDQYFRCGGCGRFVAYSQMQKHYASNHKEGIATESPPAPSTVANPQPAPMVHGYPVPPRLPEPKQASVVFDIVLMKRNFPKAFWVYTAMLVALTMMITSNLFLWIVFHI